MATPVVRLALAARVPVVLLAMQVVRLVLVARAPVVPAASLVVPVVPVVPVVLAVHVPVALVVLAAVPVVGLAPVVALAPPASVVRRARRAGRVGVVTSMRCSHRVAARTRRASLRFPKVRSSSSVGCRHRSSVRS